MKWEQLRKVAPLFCGEVKERAAVGYALAATC